MKNIQLYGHTEVFDASQIPCNSKMTPFRIVLARIIPPNLHSRGVLFMRLVGENLETALKEKYTPYSITPQENYRAFMHKLGISSRSAEGLVGKTVVGYMEEGSIVGLIPDNNFSI
jgi:hypothetical protein